ncbi:MAG TPA: HemK family protein methyltransferase, partial [Quisquiliibacterium sp.]|nr:HemK family protein methyltransferase [Quisquiliibacterium sp.]
MTALEDPRRAPPVARARRVLPSAAAAARDLRTVRDLVRYACTCLEASGAMFGHGTDNAWDEAVWMVLWSLHLAPDQLDRVIDARLLPAERLAIAHLVQRRCTERVPAAYLTGEAWLRGHRFRCDARALVPRSLIAEALDEALDDWLDARAPERILDLCTGGGSLAILAALRFPDARVDASDLSRDALALARENRALFGFDDRIELVEGDLYEA